MFIFLKKHQNLLEREKHVEIHVEKYVVSPEVKCSLFLGVEKRTILRGQRKRTQGYEITPLDQRKHVCRWRRRHRQFDLGEKKLGVPKINE